MTLRVRFRFTLKIFIIIVGTHIAYQNNVLYIANKSVVFVIDVKHEINHGET